MSELSAAPAKSRRTPSRNLRTRAIRCRKCGDRRSLDLPPGWDRRTFVEIVCPKCSARGLLPTGRLILLRTLAVLAFVASVAFVVYTITHDKS